jgi:hypothetical protein
VVRREEEGLRLAEELSEGRLLVTLETLELAAERQAAERHVLERKTRLTQDERLELGSCWGCCGGTRRASRRCAASRRRRRRRTSVAAGASGWGTGGDRGAASEGRGRHHVVGGYREAGGGDGGEQGKWRSASLQGCPREVPVRLLLAGPYYYDDVDMLDMVNSLPNVARQLAGLGMVSEPNLQALRTLCSERDRVLGAIVTHYGLIGSPALGETARDVAKGLPIRLLHGGSHAAWLAAHGLMEEHPMFPLMARLEKELRVAAGARSTSTWGMGQRDMAWLAKVETHVREEKAVRR